MAERHLTMPTNPGAAGAGPLARLLAALAAAADRWRSALAHLDGVASLLMRLILAPVLIGAGWEKLNGENWFESQLDAFPFPFNVLPAGVSWFLASWTEFLGGILLLLGLGTRLVAIPLAVTMFVAAYAVHLDNGWPAIAPSNPPAQCIEGTEAHAASNAFGRWVACHNVNERTVEASKRLARARAVLREHGDYGYLNGSGPLVKLNNGIEFAATYLAMLLALAVIGGGRYLSLDHVVALWYRQAFATTPTGGAQARANAHARANARGRNSL